MDIYLILLEYHYLTELYDKDISGIYDGKTHVLSATQLKSSSLYSRKLKRKLNIPMELFRTKENHVISNYDFERLEKEYNKLIKED